MSGFDLLEGLLYDHLHATWPSLGQWSPRAGVLEDPPPALWPNAEVTPEPGDPYLELRVVWIERIQFGALPLVTYRSEGILQHDLYVAQGIGTGGMSVLCERVEAMWQAAQVPGLSVRTAQPPRDVQAPEGWFARQVDVGFWWSWSPQE